MTTTWWCEHALTADGLRRGVSVEVGEGRIRSVESDTEPPADGQVLAGLTVPGFANAHSHAFHRALRGRVQAERGTFWTWRETMYRAAARLDPDRYHRLARAVFAEMACAGIAAVGEFHYVHHQPSGRRYDDPNAMGAALLAAASDAGIRITLLDTVFLHGGLRDGRHVPVDGPQRRFSDVGVDGWAERVDGLVGNDRAHIGAAVHSVRAVDPDAVEQVAAWARGRAAPLHAHVSEQRAENDQCAEAYERTPTELLADAGALGPTFTAVHATHLSDRDVELLGRSGSAVCACPTTEWDLGDGLGPSSELVAAGIPVCLGSDSHAVIDTLAEARAVELGERARLERRGLHTAGDLLAMATVNGHRSLGWSDAGRLAVGERADLTTISLTSERTAGIPADLAVEAAVFASTAADVASVIVDGRRIVDEGRHVDIDVGAELARAIDEVMS